MHCRVSGQVQGVWFRASTQQQAERLGLSGFVRNLPDGRVEVVARGDEASLERLKEWLWQGPANAKVTDVELLDEILPVTGEGFSIRY